MDTISKNKIPKLTIKPEIILFSQSDKKLIELIKNGKITDFNSFQTRLLTIKKRPDDSKISHTAPEFEKITDYAESYVKTQKLIMEYVSILNFLEQEEYIILESNQMTTERMPFLFKERKKENTFFYDSSIFNMCESVLDKIIIPNKKALNEFYKHECMDEMTFRNRRYLKSNYVMVWIVAATLIVSIFFNWKFLNKSNDEIIEIQSKLLNTLSTNIIDLKKAVQEIDSTLQNINHSMQSLKTKDKTENTKTATEKKIPNLTGKSIQISDKTKNR